MPFPGLRLPIISKKEKQIDRELDRFLRIALISVLYLPLRNTPYFMKWSALPEPVLLQRAFLFGITGILLGTVSLLNTQLRLLDAPMGPLNGVSLLLQFFGIGLAIIVLRRPKVAVEFKEKSQLMILILAVALLFFIFSL
jgi:hypothetical protein